MAVKKVDKRSISKTLGRHTKLSAPFSWTIAGSSVDLEADGYTVDAYVQSVDGASISGPTSCTVSGTQATYHMSDSDLAEAAENGQTVLITAVAENEDTRLVSDSLALTVGDWPGADTYPE